MTTSILDVLKDFNCQEDTSYPFKIKTGIGTMNLDYRDEIVFTNFIGNEDRAKLVFGHWKNNAVAKTEIEIKSFVKSLFIQIDKYKTALKTGNFNYKNYRN